MCAQAAWDIRTPIIPLDLYLKSTVLQKCGVFFLCASIATPTNLRHFLSTYFIQGKSEAAAIGQATPIEPVLPNELQLKEGLQKVLSAKVTKEEEPEITVVELAQIESAIAESSGALHEEALEGLKVCFCC